jgi:hypothetical protein
LQSPSQGTTRDDAQNNPPFIPLPNPQSHPHQFNHPVLQEHPQSNQTPEEDDEELEPEILTSTSPTSREAIRRFSTDIGPWDPSRVGAKRPRSEITNEQYPPDRSYKDKLQTDLEELEKDSGEESRRKKRRGDDEGTRIRDKRKDDGDDGNGNGNGNGNDGVAI